jgi:hypothetical protein
MTRAEFVADVSGKGHGENAPEEAAVSEEATSFERDIRPLFREKDRQRMEWAFDLWRYEDVRDNATHILERLEAGDMPCDGAWDEDRIRRFRSWVDQGMPP